MKTKRKPMKPWKGWCLVSDYGGRASAAYYCRPSVICPLDGERWQRVLVTPIEAKKK